jgi:putative pyruvate formate lyase activating enzyme
MGAAVSGETFVRICLALQEGGAENINIVTGSHSAPALVRGIKAARAGGLVIPALWNSSAYERGLDFLEDTVDVYLPDLKTLDGAVSVRFFNAPDYPEYAEKAILRMMDLRRLGFGQSRRFPQTRVLVSGLIIRHLVLPGFLESTRQVLRWFAEHGRGRALLSLMTQYTPVGKAGPGEFVSQKEYETLLRWLEELDLGDGFYQELVPGNTRWLPDFRRENPFPPEISRPVWHWKGGFIV